MKRVRGEYWIDDCGQALYADGDVGDRNHEAFVLEQAMSGVLDALNLSFDDDNRSLHDFWEAVDTFNADNIEDYKTSDKFRDPEDTMITLLKRMGKWTPQLGELLDCALDRLEHPLYALPDTPKDVREFAIVRWGWGWVKENWIGIHRFDKETRQRIVRGIDDILDQEGFSHEDDKPIVWEIRIYSSKRRMLGTRDQLKYRFCERDPLPFSIEALTAVAKEQVRQMDLAIELPCYHNKPA